MRKFASVLLRILKITGITLAALIALLFLAPVLFPGTVSNEIRTWTNQSIKGELNFSKSRLSFFNHFPSLTLTLYDVNLKGSAPFDKDTLLSSRKLGFGINLQKLIFDHVVHINKIFLTDALMNVEVNEKGEANYNIYKSAPPEKKDSLADSSSASLRLEQIKIDNCRLLYNDKSIPMTIEADHLYYEGSGDLSKSVFDLASHIKTDSLSFSFDHQNYLTRKAIDADLITRINTQTLALIFQKNDLLINKLGLQFSGKLNFLRNGYDMDFNVASKNADLYQLITALPPEYISWLQKTTVKGSADLNLSLKGKYIASSGEMPDLGLKLNVHDGFIAYQDIKMPVTNLRGKMDIQFAHMDPEQLHAKLEDFSFQMNKDFLRASWESHGFSQPVISLDVISQMDLDNLKKAFGLTGFDMKGRLNLDADFQGKYATKVIQISRWKKDTVIASIPVFHIRCSVTDGALRYPALPETVNQIFLKLQADCADENYQHAVFRIDTLHAAALHDYIQGRASINAARNLLVSLEGLVNLSDIQKIYPLDSLQLSGMLRFNLHTAGRYVSSGHLFPKTTGLLSLDNAFIQTKYYPHPIGKINVQAHVSDAAGTLKDLSVVIRPASLVFEGKPFYFGASFSNFDDLNYDMTVRGDLDLGKIYQVFARKDIGLTGVIRADASFKGRQSDAAEKRYERLKNSGTLEVKDMRITHEYFPRPFFIRHGLFHFQQDKMWFDQFQATYGRSDVRLDGFLENAINYALDGNKILTGNFNLSSRHFNIDEFMAYSGPAGASMPITNTEAVPAGSKGVVLIPSNLNLVLKAEVEKIDYDGIVLDHFNGGVSIANAGIELTQTGFNLIGTQVGMSGKYNSISPARASFDYHLQAKDFDIHRAYQEIKMFRDLATSAQHAQGIISLDYHLSGKLNSDMRPVYPSLAGGGVLSVKNVKFNGWKLFNTVSSKTEKSDLKDPDLSKIDVKSSIKNNLITIERMKFKTGGFRIRFEGQTSFDNQINFKMRIGLPPLGIIGIPLRITGTSDAPKIKLGKNDSDPLEEKEDTAN